MIDDIEKSLALVERMQAALPMRAFTGIELRKPFQEGSKRVFPHECSVTGIHYLGDEGGIACVLDFGFGDTKNVHVVSITHLGFDRGNPLAREIKAYRKHRIKRLKKNSMLEWSRLDAYGRPSRQWQCFRHGRRWLILFESYFRAIRTQV